MIFMLDGSVLKEHNIDFVYLLFVVLKSAPDIGSSSLGILQLAGPVAHWREVGAC